MTRSSPALAAALCAALTPFGFGRSAAADPPPKPAARLLSADPSPDHELFLLYVLEDFFRDTAIEPGKLPAEPRRLKDFLQIRRTQVDKLLSYVERSASIRPAFRDALVAYRGTLTSLKLEELQARLSARQEEYDAGVRAIYAAVDAEMADRRSEAMDDIGRTVVEAGLQAPYLSDERRYRYMMIMGTVAGTFQRAKLADAKEKLMAAASIKETAYREQNHARLREDLDDILAGFAESFAAARRDAVGKAAGLMKGVAAAKPWTAAEGEFDPDRDPNAIDPKTRPRDPFLAAWRGRKANPPEAKNREQIEAAHAAAKDCLAAEKLIPDGSAYHPFRSRLALQAGFLANLAAAADTGDAGFLHSPGRGNVDSPAYTAVRAWKKYSELEKPDLAKRGFVLHQTVTAYANAGQMLEAYKRLDDHLRSAQKAKALSAISDPEMWYDFSRIAALRPYPGQPSKLKPDTDLALDCLKMARRLGFDRRSEAEVIPDFQHLVKSGQKSQKSFQEALNAAELVKK